MADAQFIIIIPVPPAVGISIHPERIHRKTLSTYQTFGYALRRPDDDMQSS
jgi:hypothetical protein